MNCHLFSVDIIPWREGGEEKPARAEERGGEDVNGEKERAAFLNDDTDRLLSIDEVALRLRSGRDLVEKLLAVGALQALRFRKNRRIPKSVFNQFIAEHVGEDLYEVVEAAGGKG